MPPWSSTRSTTRETSTTIRATTATSTRATTRKGRPDRPLPARLIVVLVGWTLFAFAHVYLLTLVPLAGAVLVLALLARPAIATRGTRLLDAMLILSMAAIALQLVPLPPDLRGRVAPAAMVYDQAMRVGAAAAATRPVSIDPAATRLGLLALAAMVALFWSARTVFTGGGLRAAVRGVAWMGLAVSPVAIVHHLIPIRFVDSLWMAAGTGLRPYGPFVNRNDFAGWLVMALPLTLGYVVARITSRHRPHKPFSVQAMLDSRSVWLGGSACFMAAGLVVSLSRSGLTGAVVGLLAFVCLSRGPRMGARLWWALAGVAALVAAAAMYADLGALALRFSQALSGDFGGRMSIWRQTWAVVRDFWPLGAGVGAYQRVMVLYQTSSRLFYISHADNELLQIAAEGGLLVGLPAAGAMLAGIWLAWARLGRDQTPVFWVRLGALSGMLAFAVQNMVEMTLRVPATSALFAILAAVALHEASPDAPVQPARHGTQRSSGSPDLHVASHTFEREQP